MIHSQHKTNEITKIDLSNSQHIITHTFLE